MPVTLHRYDADGNLEPLVLYTVPEVARSIFDGQISAATLYRRIREEGWPHYEPSPRKILLSPDDCNEILDLIHVRDRGIPDQSEVPTRLGVPVDLDETGPLE